MGTAELGRKQTELIAGVSAADRLNKAIAERQAKLKIRLDKLARLNQFTPFATQRKKIEAFVRRVQVQEKQIGAMKKSHAVANQKVQAILNRDKKDMVAFERLLDRANESMERYGKSAALHLVTLDNLIAEADKILASK